MKVSLLKYKRSSELKSIEPVNYSLQNTFHLDTQYTGKHVSLTLASTGVPLNEYFNNITAMENTLDENEPNLDDEAGFASMFSGFISYSKKEVTGIAPNITFNYIKCLDSYGEGNHASVLAAILLAITKNTNLLVLPLTFRDNFQAIETAIQKASKENILVITESNNYFPSSYPNVLSIKMSRKLTENFTIQGFKENTLIVSAPKKEYYTAYNNNTFIEADKKLAIFALTTGLICTLLEKTNKSVENLYKELGSFAGE